MSDVALGGSRDYVIRGEGRKGVVQGGMQDETQDGLLARHSEINVIVRQGSFLSHRQARCLQNLNLLGRDDQLRVAYF